MTNFKLNKREKNRIKAAFRSIDWEKIFTVVETIFEENIDKRIKMHIVIGDAIQKEDIREQNSKNASAKAEKPERIQARKKIFEKAQKIREESKKELTINAIAEKISNQILFEGSKKSYGIYAENPKNTIYKWLKKYPDEWT